MTSKTKLGSSQEQVEASVMAQRLRAAGVPSNRLYWQRYLSHNRLLALLSFANVALDPLYFGGDGSTREAFEMGCPVITWPTAALGARWTAAMYAQLGFEARWPEVPVVSSAEQYVEAAVSLATNVRGQGAILRRALRERVTGLRGITDGLFLRADAIDSWEDALLSVV